MLGGAGHAGGVFQLLQGYEAVLDELLGDGDDRGDHVGTPWIGTEEDVLVLMMQRNPSLFAPIRSGVVCFMGCCRWLWSSAMRQYLHVLCRRRSHLQQLPHAAGAVQ